VDEYCQLFEDMFPEVRSYEAFKLLHLGMISEIKRKSLPAIAKAVGLDNQQNLHHFLSESPWQVQQLRLRRLELILKVLQGRSLILLIDETGDCKKGKSTDYVKRQYIGNVGKKENGIVAVTAYGLVDGMILPLSFEVYKPRERLKDGDEYYSKPQIAATMISAFIAMETAPARTPDSLKSAMFQQVERTLRSPAISRTRASTSLLQRWVLSSS
jgi:SRSO17 transposase